MVQQWHKYINSQYTIETNLRCDRTDTANGIGGGLLVYIKTGYNIIPLPNHTSFNQISSFSIKGKDKDQDLSIYLVYRSPNSLQANNKLLFEALRKVNKNSIIIGDFNLRNIDWETVHGTDQKSQLFLESIKDAQLTQLVNFPTHSLILS